ncbi:MAG TPA: bacteriohopanetetrol glucosamine biosynthesis glycosyltransferase HpnI [Hyphomicrobiales bacterium]|nr:bacteriohopanetetrol glucosamine biosynthesis glycosyltransferase HpnI [Hyphomicrobiales bacterium]
MSSVSGWLGGIFFVLAAIGCIYLAAALVLVRRFLARRPPPLPTPAPSITVLKPLFGVEPQLEACLGSLGEQDYPAPYEIVLGLQDPADPAAAAAERLAAAFPAQAIALRVDRTVHGTNRKVSNLINMARHIHHGVVVLADSDIAVGRHYLATTAAALAAPGAGAVTWLYYGLPGRGPWAALAALGIDAHFLPNVMVGVATGLAHPCLGSTVALRRETLEAIGGFQAVADDLADDYALGAKVRGQGGRVDLAPGLVGHACDEAGLGELLRHELRWARTIRTVDPLGHAGAVVTHPAALALIGIACGSFACLPLLALALALRAAIVATVARAAGTGLARLWLLPVRDVLSFAVFLWSFLGSAISWRGEDFQVRADGTLARDRSIPLR